MGRAARNGASAPRARDHPQHAADRHEEQALSQDQRHQPSHPRPQGGVYGEFPAPLCGPRKEEVRDVGGDTAAFA